MTDNAIPAAEKMLLIAAGLARGIYGRWQFRRLLLSVMAMAGLLIITSMLISALLITGVYASYLALLRYGWEPQAAISLTGMLLAAAIVLLIAFTVISMRRLRRKFPIGNRADEALNAFLDGFMAEDRP